MDFAWGKNATALVLGQVDDDSAFGVPGRPLPTHITGGLQGPGRGSAPAV